MSSPWRHSSPITNPVALFRTANHILNPSVHHRWRHKPKIDETLVNVWAESTTCFQRRFRARPRPDFQQTSTYYLLHVSRSRVESQLTSCTEREHKCPLRLKGENSKSNTQPALLIARSKKNSQDVTYKLIYTSSMLPYNMTLFIPHYGVISDWQLERDLSYKDVNQYGNLAICISGQCYLIGFPRRRCLTGGRQNHE